MSKKIFFALIITALTLSIHAQTAKYSNEFLSLGVGARGLAMSNSMSAISSDVTSGYWNPAGLVRMEKRYQLSLMHAAYFANIANYDYAALGYRMDSLSAVSLSFIRLGIDDIMNTTQLVDHEGNFDYSKISKFSTADMAFSFAYAHGFRKVKGLTLGGSVKVIRRRIGDFAGAWGFGLDFGLQYQKKGWQVGAVLRDATSTFNAWTYHLSDEMIHSFQETDNELPINELEITIPKLIIGGAKYVDFGKGFNATFALDLDFTFDGKRHTLISSKVICLDPHFGMEFAYKKIVALRAGIGNFQREKDFDNKTKTSLQINLGIGVCIKDIVTIDYALTDLGNLSVAPYSHVFSIKVGLDRFSKKKN
ncbi:MAG: PorV/PorQ family protein [Bacteroidales bacterium]|nr:PorV/PorQ family protein [Bacteroidales bacterium]